MLRTFNFTSSLAPASRSILTQSGLPLEAAK